MSKNREMIKQIWAQEYEKILGCHESYILSMFFLIHPYHKMLTEKLYSTRYIL